MTLVSTDAATASGESRKRSVIQTIRRLGRGVGRSVASLASATSRLDHLWRVLSVPPASVLSRSPLSPTRWSPTPPGALECLRTDRELSVRYLVENVSICNASQLRSFLVGAVTDLAVVGYVQASEILTGPFISRTDDNQSSCCSGGFGRVPEGVHAPRTFLFHSRWGSGRSRHRLGAILMTAFPLGPRPALLKVLWMPTAQLIPSITLRVVAASLTTAATAPLVWWHQLRSALADHHAVHEVA
jgi:hypothetical protein